MANYTQLLAVAHELASIPTGSTLERVMDRLQADAAAHPMRYAQLAAIRFYLRDLFLQTDREWLDRTSRLTNYHPLLDQLQTWRERSGNQPVCIVTFNYDLLLEDALDSVGLDWASFDGYIAGPDWTVIKPHGSINWIRETDEPKPSGLQPLIRHAAEYKPSTRYKVARIDDIRALPDLYYPALAIPLESGKDFECPPEHLGWLRDHLRETTEILIIGWRATEKSFLKLLADNIPAGLRFPLTIVCGNGTEGTATANNLAGSGVGQYAHRQIFNGGFGRFVDEKHIASLLT